MTTEERISRLEGTYEQVDKRLDDLNQSLSFLRTEFGVVRGEIGSLRDEMRGEIGSLRDEMHTEFGAVRSENSGLRDEMHGEIGSLRTEVRTEFNVLRGEMNSRFNMMYVVTAGSWITLMGAIIGLFLAG